MAKKTVVNTRTGGKGTRIGATTIDSPVYKAPEWASQRNPLNTIPTPINPMSQ
jgi:hypothetical protein